MVDYTKPEYRDETWMRWKGGQQLADDLRNFYTSKSRLDAIARSNPMAANATGCKGCEARRKKIIEWGLRNVGGDRYGKRKRFFTALQKKIGAAATPASAAAASKVIEREV